MTINRGKNIALQVNDIPDEIDEITIFNMLYKYGLNYIIKSDGIYFFLESVQGKFYRPDLIFISDNSSVIIDYNKLKDQLEQLKNKIYGIVYF